MQWNTPCNSVKFLQQRVKCQRKKVLFVEVRGMGRTKSINWKFGWKPLVWKVKNCTKNASTSKSAFHKPSEKKNKWLTTCAIYSPVFLQVANQRRMFKRRNLNQETSCGYLWGEFSKACGAGRAFSVGETQHHKGLRELPFTCTMGSPGLFSSIHNSSDVIGKLKYFTSKHKLFTVDEF